MGEGILPRRHCLRKEDCQLSTRVIDTSQTHPSALIGCVVPVRWILAHQITATGWSHRQWTFKQLTCILFYCQVIMTILANITKSVVTDYMSNTSYGHVSMLNLS